MNLDDYISEPEPVTTPQKPISNDEAQPSTVPDPQPILNDDAPSSAPDSQIVGNLAIKNDPDLLPRQKGYLMLRQQGFNQKDSAQLVGYNPSNGTHLDKKLSQRYDLTSTNFVKLAAGVIKSTLKGEPVGQVEKVKDSTVLAAAQMVYDRVQPVKREGSSNVTLNFYEVSVHVDE